jgi:hypothetical protein
MSYPHDLIERFVAMWNETYERFIANGFRFRPLDNALAHHDAIKFSWEMIDADRRSIRSERPSCYSTPSEGFGWTTSSPRRANPPRPQPRPTPDDPVAAVTKLGGTSSEFPDARSAGVADI